MTENEFVELLYRGGSESLDFKSEQYVFVGGSEEQKAELLLAAMIKVAWAAA